jgi:putative membrane protein
MQARMLGRTVTVALTVAGSALAACARSDRAASDSAAARGAMTSGVRDTALTNAVSAITDGGRTMGGGGGMTDANIVAVLDNANRNDSAGGALAVQKGRSADVKNFGRLMMGEHHALRQEGQALARKLGVMPQPPAHDTLQTLAQQATARLRTLSGADFDREYINSEVTMHQEVLRVAQQAERAAQNDSLKALIRRAAPVIQKHLDRAKEIQGRLGGGQTKAR